MARPASEWAPKQSAGIAIEKLLKPFADDLLGLRREPSDGAYVLGGLAGLTMGALAYERRHERLEPVDSLLKHTLFPTALSPIIVHLPRGEVPYSEQDANDEQAQLADDLDIRHDAEEVVQQPFQTSRFVCRYPAVDGGGSVDVDCQLKLLSQFITEPRLIRRFQAPQHTFHWLWWSAVIVEHLFLGADLHADSDGHYMAMLVMRWASLFGRAALTSENARRHPHVPLAPAVLDEKVHAGMRRAMRDMLCIDAGYIVVEKWLSKLVSAEAEQHAEWEWRHTGAEHEDCPPSLCADYGLLIALLRDALELTLAEHPRRGDERALELQHALVRARSLQDPQAREFAIEQASRLQVLHQYAAGPLHPVVERARELRQVDGLSRVLERAHSAQDPHERAYAFRRAGLLLAAHGDAHGQPHPLASGDAMRRMDNLLRLHDAAHAVDDPARREEGLRILDEHLEGSSARSLAKSEFAPMRRARGEASAVFA